MYFVFDSTFLLAIGTYFPGEREKRGGAANRTVTRDEKEIRSKQTKGGVEEILLFMFNRKSPSRTILIHTIYMIRPRYKIYCYCTVLSKEAPSRRISRSSTILSTFTKRTSPCFLLASLLEYTTPGIFSAAGFAGNKRRSSRGEGRGGEGRGGKKIVRRLALFLHIYVIICSSKHDIIPENTWYLFYLKLYLNLAACLASCMFRVWQCLKTDR